MGKVVSGLESSDIGDTVEELVEFRSDESRFYWSVTPHFSNSDFLIDPD